MTKYQNGLIPRKEADKVGLVALVGGLITGAAFGWHLSNDRIKNNYIPRDEAVISENVDMNGIQDLVIGKRIFLADRTADGVVYRPLKNSDVYRIR